MLTLPKRFVQRLIALLLITTLGACVGSRGEPFAPELRKGYVLTEDLVISSRPVVHPGLMQSSIEVTYVMTQDQLRLLNGFNLQYPNNGELEQGKRARVTRMFTYNDLNARTRYGRLQFTDPVKGEQFTAYGNWEYIGPKLKEAR